MLIKQILHEAFQKNDINLQALIMFLVFEKEVLSMESDKSELDLYFLPKHQERMNKELRAYKQKMNLVDKPSCYKVFTKRGETLYIKAKHEQQAKAYAQSLNYKVLEIKYVSESMLISFNGVNKTIRDIMGGKPEPYLLGVNAVEQKYNWRNLK